MINATLGTVEYREGGVIAVPVTFPENVIAPSKSIFEITYISGDALTDIEYRLVGQNTAFTLIVEMPLDRMGSFQIAANGDVFKVASGSWENVVVTSITVNYNTIVPKILDYDIPANYTPGENFDVKVALNTIVTGIHSNNIQDVFILEGANLGTPDPYKWTGTPPTDSELRGFLQTELVDDLNETDWQALAAPPAGDPTPGMNRFNEDGTQWHGEELQYLLVRFSNIPAGITGTFNMTLRESTIRGPIS